MFCFIKTKRKAMKTNLVINKEESRNQAFFSLSTAHRWAGPLTAVSLVLFFLVMKSFKLHELLYLRYFNGLFLISAVLFALFQYRKYYSDGKGIDYLTGLRLGAMVTLTATIPFAFFMGVYLMLDTAFMDYIKINTDLGYELTPGIAAISLFIEGLSSGLIFTFMLMQYLKYEDEI